MTATATHGELSGGLVPALVGIGCSLGDGALLFHVLTELPLG